MRLDEQSVKSSRVYWRCQRAGWLGFGLFQISPVLLGIPPRPRFGTTLILALVRSLAGLLTTHVFRLWIIRRGWLRTVGPVLPMRLLAGVAMTAACGATSKSSS